MAYIYLDVINMKDLYKTNPSQAKRDYLIFVEACRIKALQSDSRRKYINFSDSLLISLDNDIISLQTVKEEYDWFKEHLRCLYFYIIVNTGNEIRQLPDIEPGELERDLMGQPRYIQIAGFGSDFSDIFLAEMEIKKKRRNGELKNNLRVYISQNLLPGLITDSEVEFIKISGLDGEKIFVGYESLD